MDGETRVVMEDTGNYHAPVATRVLYDTRLYVSVINAKLVHGYRNNDLRCAKTDRKDALKLANYSLIAGFSFRSTSRRKILGCC